MSPHFTAAQAPGQRRAIGVNLVIYFLFALVAVLLLTRTAIAANAINDDVAAVIQPVTGSINESTKGLAVLDTTVAVTDKIAAGAEPLSGHLSGVVEATGRIDSNLDSTNTHVTSIDDSVEEIKKSTGQIKPAIDELNDTVGDIHSTVRSIDKDFVGVAKGTTSVVHNLNGARASLAAVLDGAGPLHDTVLSILATALKINGHADSIQGSPALLSSANLPLNVLQLLGLAP